MKNAIIFHGTWDNPELFWFPYVKKWLEEMGYSVWSPELPNAERPNLKDWLSFVLENGIFTEETVLIGYSAGAQLIPSILEKIDVTVSKSILVSGYAKPLPKDDETEKEKDEFRWSEIVGKSKEFYFVNSDNDPWGCNDTQWRIFFDHLGGNLIIRHEGHMGSSTFNQPYRDFPLVLKLCRNIND